MFLSRRNLIRIGCLAPFGLACHRLEQGVKAKGADLLASASSPRAKSCILLWLDGGPSHFETFDPKPDLPVEVRGPFGSIGTKAPGIRLSELLPKTAEIANRLAIVRSMTSPLGEHGLANHYLLTGYKPSSQLNHPSFSSIASHLKPAALLPNYVALPELRANMGGGFLGTGADPFVIPLDPKSKTLLVRDLDHYPGIDPTRLERREMLLRRFNAMQKEGNGEQTKDGFEAAFRLLDSADAKQAFDIHREPEEFRDRYGARSFGQGCLLARRLVERGVPLVTVVQTGWDTHDNLVLQLRDGYSGAKLGVGLVPTFDQAFASLIQDLDQRGMLDETLVIAMGEFGRTPKLNARGGRDHWSRVFSVVMAGAGIEGGQVIGESDRIGESPKEQPISPSDLVHTIFQLLGVDPNQDLMTSDGRPIRVNQGGHSIRQIIA